MEEEEEPKLKYQRMGGSLPSLLSTDAAASIAIAERMIAIGTHDGTVHILDFQGNQVDLTFGLFSIALFIFWRFFARHMEIGLILGEFLLSFLAIGVRNTHVEVEFDFEVVKFCS